MYRRDDAAASHDVLVDALARIQVAARGVAPTRGEYGNAVPGQLGAVERARSNGCLAVMDRDVEREIADLRQTVAGDHEGLRFRSSRGLDDDTSGLDLGAPRRVVLLDVEEVAVHRGESVRAGELSG